MTRFNPDLRPLIVACACLAPLGMMRLTLWFWTVPPSAADPMLAVISALLMLACGGMVFLGLYDPGAGRPIRLFREGDQ